VTNVAERTPRAPGSRDGVEGWGRRLAQAPGRADSLRHLRVLPRREAVTAAWPTWADPRVVDAFRRRGILEPWRHQVVAAEAAWSGQHVVGSTGTASGKSLAYQLPALSAVLGRRGGHGE
jgi:DEAD/DEAH box helicase domain-containing protein